MCHAAKNAGVYIHIIEIRCNFHACIALIAVHQNTTNLIKFTPVICEISAAKVEVLFTRGEHGECSIRVPYLQIFICLVLFCNSVAVTFFLFF